MAPSKRLALVVGGAGFLGKHIVQQLLDTGRYSVRVFDIRPCGIDGANMRVGDIRKQEVRLQLCALFGGRGGCFGGGGGGNVGGKGLIGWRRGDQAQPRGAGSLEREGQGASLDHGCYMV
jgi:hypothetical protein